MCVLTIKVPIRKKSGNLFNDPRIYLQRADLKTWVTLETNQNSKKATHMTLSLSLSLSLSLYIYIYIYTYNVLVT